MAELKAFKGVRYNKEKAGELDRLICPPYDIISESEKSIYYEKSEYNIIRIEHGIDYITDDSKNNKYTRASAYLSNWMARGILVAEDKPSIYVYQQNFKDEDGEMHARTGFISLVKLVDLSEGIILAHENTLTKPKSDRMNLIVECEANISKIYTLFKDEENYVTIILQDIISAHTPVLEYAGMYGGDEKLWLVSDEEIITRIVNYMSDKQLFIADGHHRYETCLSFKKICASNNLAHVGDEPYNYAMMLMVSMDNPGLMILPTHRAINNKAKVSINELLSCFSDRFEIQNLMLENISIKEKALEIKKILNSNGSGTFVCYRNQKPNTIIFKIKDYSYMEKALPHRHESYRNLDVCILHKLLIEPLLNIEEKQLADQEFIMYTHDVQEGIEWVESGKSLMVFFMNPTSTEQVRSISLAGEKMPQKSTYFYPKPPTGLVLHKF